MASRVYLESVAHLDYLVQRAVKETEVCQVNRGYLAERANLDHQGTQDRQDILEYLV